jgi:ribosomal protein S18 acetylase RimI-like enzyme
MLGIRAARADDYDAVISVVDDWWGRDVAGGLPRLFLDHFYGTSLVAEDDGALAGFLVGFCSPGQPHEAYIHYVAVDPGHRGGGLGRRIYEEFLGRAIRSGCSVARAITSPGNQGSIAFHRRMGFDVAGPVPGYNGPGRDMIVFSRVLAG